MDAMPMVDVILWIIFAFWALLIVTIDIRTDANHVDLRASATKTAIYTAIAVAFGITIGVWRSVPDALSYFTTYSLEMSLSFDNIFVISLILGALSIPAALRERVLFYGIMGAVILRGIFIGAGVGLIGNFHWLLVPLAIFLAYSGIRMLIAFRHESEEDNFDIESNRTLELLRRWLPIYPSLWGRRFFVRTGATSWKATPLFVALVVVEVADVVFATDSIPASLGVTTDPLIVFSSNIFAVIGLRSMFFILEAMVNRFVYLKPALAIALVLIGIKMVGEQIWDIGGTDNLTSLAVILSILVGSVIFSIIRTRNDGKTRKEGAD